MKKLTKKRIEEIHISEGIYRAIQKYHTLSDSDLQSYCKGILGQKDTWLLEKIEEIIGIKSY